MKKFKNYGLISTMNRLHPFEKDGLLMGIKFNNPGEGYNPEHLWIMVNRNLKKLRLIPKSVLRKFIGKEVRRIMKWKCEIIETWLCSNADVKVSP